MANIAVQCRGSHMKMFLIAAVAVAISGAAYAKDLKGSVMSNSEMDKVTAGDGFVGFGLGTASGPGSQNGFFNGIQPHAADIAQSPNPPGFGNCTANRPSC